MGRRGQTSKPCEGCGDASHSREIGKVCLSCQRRLELAAAYIEETKDSGFKPYRIPWAAHILPYIPRGSKGTFDRGSAADRFRTIFYGLLRSVSRRWLGSTAGYETGCFDHHMGERDRLRRTGDPHGGGTEVVAVDPAMMKLLRELYAAAMDVAEAAYEEGHEDGRNLLSGLASGEVSMEDLAEHDARRAKAVQRKPRSRWARRMDRERRRKGAAP